MVSHVIKSTPWYLSSRQSLDFALQKLFVHMNDCSREYDSQYVLGYLDCLELWNGFLKSFASLLPIGRTDEDIFHTILRTSQCPKENDAVIRTELPKELHSSCNKCTSVTAMSIDASISRLFESESFIHCDFPALWHFRKYHFFHNENELAEEKINNSTDRGCTSSVK